MKNFKTFLKHHLKASYISGTKISEQTFTGIYRYLLSKLSENSVLGCQEMVQCKCLILSELRFFKRVRFSKRNCMVKWVIFFDSFCWLWDFPPENLKLVDKPFPFLVQIFFGGEGDCIRAFQSTMVDDIFIQPPHHEKVSYDPDWKTSFFCAVLRSVNVSDELLMKVVQYHYLLV